VDAEQDMTETNTAGVADALPADGRNRRRAANRERIVHAFLELVRAGTPTPSAQAVAEQAGVSPRTVFRCFQDMESLYREIVVALHEEFLPRARLNLDTPDRRERLERLVANRAAMFEDMTPFREAAEIHRFRSPALAGDRAFLVAMERERLETALNPDGAMDPHTMEALCAVTCYDFWSRLRKDQALDPAAAAAVMRSAAMAVLAAGPDAGPVRA
jgi:AcrR family transcriptional regulator